MLHRQSTNHPRRWDKNFPNGSSAFRDSSAELLASGELARRCWRLEVHRSPPSPHFGGMVSSAPPAETDPPESVGAETGKSAVEELARARQRLEAILLVSREPISSRKLAALADLADATQARTLTRQLNELYDEKGHAFRVEEVAGGWMMLTRPQFAKWLRKLEWLRPVEHLSQGLLETLAIVAYRQPVPRAEIEAIRGIGCDETLRQLMQRDLVRICGRSEELGRPYLYGITKRFLQLFGLKSLERLPRADWVRQVDVQFPVSESDKEASGMSDPSPS
jgi:segregation and condensation protein B